MPPSAVVMTTPTRNLLLVSDAERNRCTLRFENTFHSWFFSSVNQALQFATTLVEEETPIVVLDFEGQVLNETTVSPAG